MTRSRFLLAASLTLAACGRGGMPMPDAFPETAGAWHRVSLGELTAAHAPDPLPEATIERIRAAAYEGPGKVEARVYQLTSAAVALDAGQRWKPAANTVAFESDRFFVVVQWQTAERTALQDFVRGLETRMRAGKRGGNL
jgi:hypothetical protein